MPRRHPGEEGRVAAFTAEGLLGGRRAMFSALQKRLGSQYQHDVRCVESSLRMGVLMAWDLSSATQHLSNPGRPGNILNLMVSPLIKLELSF